MSRFLSALCAATCVATLVCGSLTAALPPLYQGMTEFNAILHDPQFAKSIPSGDVLEEIKKTPTGYEVTTNHSILQIDIEYLPQQYPGPAQFNLHFHPIQSRSGS